MSNMYLLDDRGRCINCSLLIPNCYNCSDESLCLSCNEGFALQEGVCIDDSGVSAGWIVVIVICSLVVAVGIGAGIYYLWKRRRGFMGPEDGSQPDSQLRSTYYEIP